MKRQTILGPYELIDGYWVSQGEGKAAGDLTVIEDKLYYGIRERIELDEEDICTRKDWRSVIKWYPVTSDMLNASKK